MLVFDAAGPTKMFPGNTTLFPGNPPFQTRDFTQTFREIVKWITYAHRIRQMQIIQLLSADLTHEQYVGSTSRRLLPGKMKTRPLPRKYENPSSFS